MTEKILGAVIGFRLACDAILAAAGTVAVLVMLYLLLTVGSPARAQQAAPQCHQVVSILAEAKAHNMSVTLIADGALSKAKRFYAETPPEGPEPEADAALLIEVPERGGLLIFVRGDQACDFVSTPSVQQFNALRTVLLGNHA